MSDKKYVGSDALTALIQKINETFSDKLHSHDLTFDDDDNGNVILSVYKNERNLDM